MWFLDLAVGLFAIAFLYRYLVAKTTSKRLPPGPKPMPLLGNLFDLPKDNEWLTFAEWGKTYGDISSVTVLGQTFVIVNTLDVALELLDKRSLTYSDRPILSMADLIGYSQTVALLPLGKQLRTSRRYMHQLFGTSKSATRFHPIEEFETRQFLRGVLAKPENLAGHIRRITASIIFRISHGYELEEENDPFVTLAATFVEQFSTALAPGSFLVNLLPQLAYLPEWFPGAGFKKTCQEWKKVLHDALERPHVLVKERMAAGTAAPSFTSALLDKPGLTAEQEEDIKWAALSLYSAGADTTVSAIYAFFNAITLYPQIQEKAQSEIDQVIGSGRLPRLTDRKDLPYTNALVSEVLRWHSVAPTALPHRVLVDDEHRGFFIPQGSIIIPNTWNMTHNPEMYKDPMAFNPDRFMTSKDHIAERDPREMCFGFGRRICPGRFLADSSLFIVIACNLAVLNVSRCEVEPSYSQTSGTISHPAPFQCTITARSKKAAGLISAEE